MLCLRCRAIPSTLRTATSSIIKQTPLLSIQQPSKFRPFSLATTTTTRPSVLSQSQRPSLLSLLPTTSAISNQLQSRFFSASSSLGAKRNTYNPSRRVQKRRHGFLARLRSKGGMKIIKRRRARGRKNLSW
ncbi:ribosomal protein L34-domain-containing protein [Aspergillus spectabilis]